MNYFKIGFEFYFCNENNSNSQFKVSRSLFVRSFVCDESHVRFIKLLNSLSGNASGRCTTLQK